MMDTPKPQQKHTALEDAQGLLFGSFVCGASLVLLTHLGLVTGQTAGLAVLISYLTGISVGTVFFVINLPFYWLAYQRMGVAFTLKTFIAVGLLSLFTEFLPLHLGFGDVTPWIGALLFGCMAGGGLLALFRHGASLGGIGILALYLQDRTGFRAGWTQLIVDACIFAVAAFVLEPGVVAASLLGALIVNLVIAINHRKDRYIGT